MLAITGISDEGQHFPLLSQAICRSLLGEIVRPTSCIKKDAGMALPGLNLDALSVPLDEEKTVVVHELATNTEWRFEVAFDQTIEVKVGTSGATPVF